MTAAAPHGATDDTKRTSYLELFFDLVFVFAITQLAGMLHEDHTARGWGHAAIMAWLVWSSLIWYAAKECGVKLEGSGAAVSALALLGALATSTATAASHTQGRTSSGAAPPASTSAGAMDAIGRNVSSAAWCSGSSRSPNQ